MLYHVGTPMMETWLALERSVCLNDLTYLSPEKISLN